ncbi:MAG: rod shape-determining protein RodA [Verrucomicrobia bacterium]|nr:rod shape-determining protein RodA [Verrucomicrobiota bacterium]
MSDTLSLNPRESRLDWLMLVALGALMLIGVAFVYSATMASDTVRVLPLLNQPWIRQLIWFAVGLGAATCIVLVDYHTLSRWSLVFYWATTLLLVLVLIPHIGSMRFGARRWIDLGPFSLQPSEFAKLSLIFLLSHFLSRPVDELRQPKLFFTALGLAALPFILILKEPDLGSALTLFPIALVMLFVAGVPPRYLWRVVFGATVVISLVLGDILFASEKWQFIKLESYQKRRLQVYFGLDFAPPNATEEEQRAARVEQRKHTYNVEQALISVGSGGLMGKGWRQGTQNALGYLPRAVAHNDFIFSVIAEETGFVGSLTVIGLYTVVLFCGLRVAGQARDRLGKLLAVGVVTLLFSHVFVNIGMNIRLMPVTGIPLPLLSYGGSSVLCSLVAAGILQNVHLHRRYY